MNEFEDLVAWGELTFDVSGVSENVKKRVRRNRYEGQSVDRIQSSCPTDIPFVNFGGGMGIVDCIQNARMADRAKHIAVEGNPESCLLSVRNRALNNARYTIQNAALCYSDTASFFVPDMATELIMAGSVDDRFATQGMAGKQVTVPGITFQDIIDLTGWKSVALCVDVEGAEYALIENELDSIARHADWLLIEWHFSNDKTDPDYSRSFLAKKSLKQEMIFHADKSNSRMSVFSRKPRSFWPLGSKQR